MTIGLSPKQWDRLRVWVSLHTREELEQLRTKHPDKLARLLGGAKAGNSITLETVGDALPRGVALPPLPTALVAEALEFPAFDELPKFGK